MTELKSSVADTLVRVQGLSKSYGAIRAVDGISFDVGRGDVLAFLGPNGAGKTTAMKMITGFLEPDAGRVELCGLDVQAAPIEARRHLGYLPENAPAYGEMNAREFLEFVAEARGVDGPSEAIDRVVGMTGLAKVLRQPIETLSKGYKRRVGLAQALIHDPEVLILDEPTDGLDPNQKAMVQDLLSSLSSDRCIVLSTHILDEAERIANRAVILSQGKILVDSTPAELMGRASEHNHVEIELGSVPSESLVEAIRASDWCAGLEVDGARLVVHPSVGERPLGDVLAVIAKHDGKVRDVHVREGRLDDLFREITKGVAA